MLLAVDIGNTNIVVGCFNGEELAFVFRLKTDPDRTVDEYAASLFSLFERKLGAGYAFGQCIISSVVPPLTQDIASLVEGMFGLQPLIVGPGIKTGLRINLPDPSAVGADRVVNAIAARELYGTPALVIDFGTATSFDYIDKDGSYQGGIIAPGVRGSLDSLVSHTAKLPRIELAWPDRVIGKSTVGAMQSGSVVGYVCMVDGLIARIREEVGELSHIITTGGLGELFSERCTSGISAYAPDLTMHGLRIIAELNGS
jgi:type III pantothenate kinase